MIPFFFLYFIIYQIRGDTPLDVDHFTPYSHHRSLRCNILNSFPYSGTGTSKFLDSRRTNTIPS